MENFLIFLLIYQFILINIYSAKIFRNPNINSYLNHSEIHHLILRILDNTYVNKNKALKNDNLNKGKKLKKGKKKKLNKIKLKESNTLLIKKFGKYSHKLNNSLLLIGFDIFEKNLQKIKFFTYFKTLKEIFPDNLSFNMEFYFHHLNKTKEKNIICNLDEYNKSRILKYNCSLAIDTREKKIKKIKLIIDSFKFDNISYEIIISPIVEKTIQNIKNEKNKIFRKLIAIHLFEINNGNISIDEKNKKVYIKESQLNKKNNFLNENGIINEKNIIGDYIFPFKDELNNFKETNVSCQIKDKIQNFYNIECILNGPILTNINEVIGYGINENNKNIFLIFNITHDLLNFQDNNVHFYKLNFVNTSAGLSSRKIALIVIICVIFFFIISILFLN